jgi:SsrA-binding protein
MKIFNRTFEREYEKLETVEAGVVLTGPEAKATFLKQIRLDGSYVKLMRGEAFLINADIQKYKFAKQEEYDPKRSRKLLLHKKELLKLQTKTAEKGLTLIPVSCYEIGPYIKIEIAIARGRKDLEKRKLEKNRDITRNEKKEAKEWMKR